MGKEGHLLRSFLGGQASGRPGEGGMRRCRYFELEEVAGCFGEDFSEEFNNQEKNKTHRACL